MAHDDGAKSVHMACEDAESVPETGVLIIMHQNEVRYGWNGHKFEAWFEMDLCCISAGTSSAQTCYCHVFEEAGSPRR